MNASAGAGRKRALIPDDFREAANALNMSPGIVSGNHVFLTGVTGSNPDGAMPDDPKTQFLNVFNKIAGVLAVADLTLDAVVEMTSYHVGLHTHFDLFDAVRLEMFEVPYPAWTAVEVALLRREGALVEVRAVAQM